MDEIYLGDGIDTCKLCGKRLLNSDRLRPGKCNDICENCHEEIFGVLRVLKRAKDEGSGSLTVDEIATIRAKEKLIKSKPSKN